MCENSYTTKSTIISYTARTYTAEDASIWDQFVAQAKNATFLFHRDFMEYHRDRFQDASLLVFKGDQLISLLPLNRKGNEVYSHQGLSYGGFVLSPKVKFNEVLAICKAGLVFLASEGFKLVHYKMMPRVYHVLPADEMEYVLFLLKAQLTRTDISSVIDLHQPFKIQSNRMEGVKKAQKKELLVREELDFKGFWNEILIPNLTERHGVKPVHTLDEIELLASRFPKNIKQFNVYHQETIVGGATIFETPHLVHVQYISGNADKQQLGSLDFLFYTLIKSVYKNKRYFDFGISNENQGMQLNEGLLYWKECFGARSSSNQFYTVETANHSLLDSVFI